ncbi:MAG: hypothetical protein P4L67_04935 [Candidatus Pacebacteria bacterium]|nr:hypothetical protein [Candidatus Paceibacterota bacterium]
MSNVTSLFAPALFLKELAQALGITVPVRRITIDSKHDDVVHVTVESIPRNEHGDKLLELLTEDFYLVKRSEDRKPLV